MIKKHKYTLLWILWVIIVISLSLMSPSEMPEPPRIPHLDKAFHFVFYFSYTVLFILSFWKEKQWITKQKKAYFWAFTTAVLLGATIEILQNYCTSARSGDIFDMLFNTFGIVVALLFMKEYKEIFR